MANHLKIKDLTWQDGPVWSPQSDYNDSAARDLPLTVDGKIQTSKFLTGEPAAILDLQLDPSQLSLPEDSMYIYTTIKAPGRRKHVLPVELASLMPFLSDISEHQFTVSKDAIDKVGYLVLRQVNASPERRIVGNVPHQDYCSIALPFKYPMALSFYVAGGFQFRDLHNGLTAKWSKVANIYHTSTAFPTMVQSRSLDVPIEIPAEKDKALARGKAYSDVMQERVKQQPDLMIQANPNQVAMANNYTWHMAPQADSEQKRLYVHLAYIPCR